MVESNMKESEAMKSNAIVLYLIALMMCSLKADMIEDFGMGVLPSLAAGGPLLPDVGPDVSQCHLPLPSDQDNTLYVCDCAEGASLSCTAGSDGAVGSAAAPKQSLAAAETAMNGGSDVAFCRGGVWRGGELHLVPPHCSAAAPCVLQDYGDPALPKPLIVNVDTAVSGGINSDPGGNDFNVTGWRIANLHLLKSRPTGNETGVFLFRNMNDVELSCLEVEGFGLGVNVNPFGLDTRNITLRDSYIHDNAEDGFLGATDHLLLLRNTFENNGFGRASVFQHNIYIGASGASENQAGPITVRRNHLIGSALDENGSCHGVSLNVHGGIIDDLLIEGNLVEERHPNGSCWGIAVDGVTGTGDRNNRARIRGNVVRDVGSVAIGVASCIDCVIENNLVIQTLLDGTTAIAVPNRPTFVPDTDNNATTVRNNTVYFGAGLSGTGFYVGERGSGYVAANNIGYFETVSGQNSCLLFDLPPAHYALVSHNLCSGGAFDSGTTGMDADAQQADPRFIRPGGNFRLRADSPAVGAATPHSLPADDILGALRSGPADLGAYERR